MAVNFEMAGDKFGKNILKLGIPYKIWQTIYIFFQAGIELYKSTELHL